MQKNQIEVKYILRKIIVIMFVALFLTGCSNSGILTIEEDIADIEQAAAEKKSETVKDEDLEEDIEEAESKADMTQDNTTLDDKMNTITFVRVSNYFMRESMQDDTPYKEIFAVEKDSFIRIGMSDSEEEVFSYNYKTDEFTYLYYFADELISKVVYRVNDDIVIEDEDQLADLLKTDAQLLKDYFYELIEEAEIDIKLLEYGGK